MLINEYLLVFEKTLLLETPVEDFQRVMEEYARLDSGVLQEEELEE